ncbi:MAG: glutamate 5-kinase [Thermodesulfobacteriota bacterium]|nr:glutamate 5-kinase [Thermodesulfobacteriota bacterium]
MNKYRQHIFDTARRVVIKAGSGVLTGDDGLNLTAVDSISSDISALMDRGIEIIFVSSGAIAAGRKKIGMTHQSLDLPARQAAAAIGQSDLIMEYENAFARCDKKVAQILLTADDLSNRRRYLNARNTIHTLLSWKVVPIINENDTVVVEEIKFGDNDNLAAMIAMLMDADLLINLTDTDGLYDKDPRTHADAVLIESVSSISKKMEEAAGTIPGALGTGGMLSKVKAAKKVIASGVPMMIANGCRPNVLPDLFAGKADGTFFQPKPHKLPSKKRWIAFSLKPKGTLVVDDGAASALVKKGKSLLPSGISEVMGDFGMGAPVTLVNRKGEKLGIGLVNYKSADIRCILGLRSCDIAGELGHKPYDEVIHRDNMVVA